MRNLLRRVARWLLSPWVWFVQWAVAQDNVIRNRQLKRLLKMDDPDSVALYGDISIGSADRCRLGHNVAIHDAHWDARGGIIIGNNVHFGPRVTILTGSHNIDGDAVPYDDTFVFKPVVIENNVWIGCDVVIAPGTHVEEGCVVAMGATVSGRIPKGSIVGTPKWRVLRTRDMEKYENLKATGKFH